MFMTTCHCSHALQVLTKSKQVLPVEPTAEAQVALIQDHSKKHEE